MQQRTILTLLGFILLIAITEPTAVKRGGGRQFGDAAGDGGADNDEVGIKKRPGGHFFKELVKRPGGRATPFVRDVDDEEALMTAKRPGGRPFREKRGGGRAFNFVMPQYGSIVKRPGGRGFFDDGANLSSYYMESSPYWRRRKRPGGRAFVNDELLNYLMKKGGGQYGWY